MRPIVNTDIDETEDDILATAVTLHYAVVHNPSTTTDAFLKVYFDDAANIAVGSDSPDIEVTIPPSQVITIPLGDRRCEAGACWAAGSVAGADATAPASGLHGVIFVSG